MTKRKIKRERQRRLKFLCDRWPPMLTEWITKLILVDQTRELQIAIRNTARIARLKPPRDCV